MESTQKTNRALWLSSFDSPPSIVELDIPQAVAGTAVVRVLASPVVPYVHLVHAGKLPQLNLALPCVPNPCAVGRVHAVSPDAVRLRPGDLVYVDATVRARDDPSVAIMTGHLGGAGPAAQRLAREWRDGSLQQFQKVPLENVYPLDEQRLLGGLGYSPAALQGIAYYSVAGGAIMEAAEVRAGETVVVGPAGGSFGGAAVELAIALGANVVALGRSGAKLAAMAEALGNHPRFRYVVMSGDDADADTAAILRATPNGAGADVYNDWSPGELEAPPYLLAAARTLKRQGRLVLSGSTHGNLNIPYDLAVLLDLKITGQWMCARRTLDRLIGMIEQGILNIGADSGTHVEVFSLDEHQRAIEYAREHGGWRHYVSVAPNQN
ncbi:NAD(P)-binding protein [Biscogniauxia marginata]|nr:NAD(P)-binding protein [Biscogniauxia marginata]